MQTFFSDMRENEFFILDEMESRHLVKVMRIKKGEEVNIIDGSGTLYKGVVNLANPDKTVISVSQSIKDYNKRNYYLHIAIAPTKNIERFEWFVEKVVEMGIDEITPLICEHSERKTIKHERTRKIIITALKQSGNTKLPILNPIVSIDEFTRMKLLGDRYIAYCADVASKAGLKDVYKKGSDAVVLIGPEGDFSEKEFIYLSEEGFIPVNLGNSRLRTETAGIATCCHIYFINQ